MKHLQVFSNREQALGMVHIMVAEFRNLPEAERFCERFEGEPEPIISQEFLRQQLWQFELSDEELYSYSLFLQANLDQQFLDILAT